MNRREKTLKFERFLSERLQPDLRAALEARDAAVREEAEFQALKDAVKLLDVGGGDGALSPGQPLEAQVDLGCNFYAQAVVDDPSKIFVSVGLGLFLELTLPEAAAFADRRIAALRARERQLSDQACQIRANIRLTQEGLRELQNVSDRDLVAERQRRRDVMQ